MGLDVSVVKNVNGVDLNEFYSIRNAVENGFDWYLGNDKTTRLSKYEELKSKVFALSKRQIIDAVLSKPDYFSKEFVNYLENISDSSWKTCVEFIKLSIGKHEPENTHLTFEWEKAPEKSLLDCCSWNFRNVMLDCAKPSKGFRPNGDSLEELDPELIKKTRNKFMFKVPKITLAKWLGYFSPDVKERMLRDITYELGLGAECYIDTEDLLTWNGWLKDICKNLEPAPTRYWLVSSY